MARGDSLAGRLYRGEVKIDFIARRRIWYAGSGLVLLISVLSLAFRGLNPSIDFKGGAVFTVPANHHSLSVARAAVTSAGIPVEVAQTVGEGRVRIETRTLTTPEVSRVEDKFVARLRVKRGDIGVDTVGASWGGQITNKALEGLAVFLVAVVIYLSIRFESKMALAAIVALLHDLTITAGIYSLSGFEVSPSTVIALLTILGYSLYDTVVVFDKVRENTAGLAARSTMTFSEAANLAVNQTLMRSINTSIIALLPVAGLLGIGAGLLGAGSLKDLSLALLIGLAAGAYSSIFIATPLLCDLKEREPAYRQLARRVATRRSRGEDEPVPAGVAVAAAGAGAEGAAVEPSTAAPGTATSPGTAGRRFGGGPAPTRPPARRRRGKGSRKRR